MVSEKLYSVKEVAEILGLTENNIKQYRWRHGIGVIQNGKLYFSDSDIAFIRARVGRGRKPKEPKEKEKTEYEKFIEAYPCRLLNSKELMQVMGNLSQVAIDLLEVYAVENVPQKCGSGKKRKLLWRETDIATMQEALKVVLTGRGGKGRSKNRASGGNYKNKPERLAEIKAKYANGVPAGEIEKWLGV